MPARTLVIVAAVMLLVAAGHPVAQAGAPVRVAPIADADLTSRDRALIASYVRGGQATNDVRVLLHHPDSLPGVMPFWDYIAFGTTLQPRDRAILMLRTAWRSRSGYLWAKYATAASGVLTADDLRAIAGATVAGGTFDASLLAAADGLHRQSFVDAATWSALASRYNTEQLMDAVFTVAETTMLGGMVNSLGVPIDSAFVAAARPQFAAAASDTRDHPMLGAPRIPPLEQTFWTGELRAMLDPDATGRDIAAVYRTFAQHPPLYRPRQELSEYIRNGSTLPPRTRELAILRIGALCGSDYEWGAHVPAGRAAGMSDAEIARIADIPRAGASSRAVLSAWSAADSAVLRSVDELFASDTLSDEAWRLLTAQFDRRQIIDLLITAGGYRMVSMALNTFGVPLEPNSARLPGR